ncbi:DUF3784 domain-containing protein [Virgibacillus alimentarius]|uniref:Small-conductance mechanosensitive channel n=1 Tax=Virgibacillus alimentarius TaxID=698769 RepID=A0ABS4S8B4_9BACI|nr:DUF3784 domain-containing protein [Virgibacillus alimentarius]MBP2257725.1 small-conductance mechanosensitive channel [Virgibacillus alimentarius]
MLISIIIIGAFIILGIILLNGKGAFLIAGFNTMPEEEKEKYDTALMCKFMGKMMFALAFSMALMALSEALGIKSLFAVSFVLFIGITLFIVIYMNTGDRFKKTK